MGHRKGNGETGSQFILLHAGSDSFDFSKDEAHERLEQVARDVKILLLQGHRVLPIIGGAESCHKKEGRHLSSGYDGTQMYESFGFASVMDYWREAFRKAGMNIDLVPGERRPMLGDAWLQHVIRSQIDGVIAHNVVPVMNEEIQNGMQVLDMVDTVHAASLGIMVRRTEDAHNGTRDLYVNQLDNDTIARMFGKGHMANVVTMARNAVSDHGVHSAFLFNEIDSTLLKHGTEIYDRRTDHRPKKHDSEIA